MPYFQNSSVDSDKLILGNYKVEVTPSAAGTFVGLGAGRVNSFGHNWEKYDSQAGNAPDPVEGIATETFTVDMEMIEYDGSVLSNIQCGSISESNTTSLSTIDGGGNQVLTSKAFRLTNTRLISGTTVETILTLYKATPDAGIAVTAKDDSDTDPVNIMPFTLTAEVDATLTSGSQLFQLTRTKV